MDDTEKKVKLFHDYGYPSEEIPTLLENAERMSYEKLEKMIMPYDEHPLQYPGFFFNQTQR